MNFVWSIPLLLLLAHESWTYLPLPDYVRPCNIKLSDRKISECATQHAIEVMAKAWRGDPTYRVPVLDPMYLKQMVVIDGKGPLGLQLVLEDVNIHGISKLIVNNITHQSNPQVITYSVTVPELLIYAKYNVSGRILLLPLVGRGNAVLKLKNVRMLYQYDWKLTKLEDGETYFLPSPDARFNIDVDGMNIKLDNLFNGDKALLETTNNFLNQEWREVFDSAKPAFSKTISELIRTILNGIYTQVPYKEAFLGTEE